VGSLVEAPVALLVVRPSLFTIVLLLVPVVLVAELLLGKVLLLEAMLLLLVIFPLFVVLVAVIIVLIFVLVIVILLFALLLLIVLPELVASPVLSEFFLRVKVSLFTSTLMIFDLTVFFSNSLFNGFALFLLGSDGGGLLHVIFVVVFAKIRLVLLPIGLGVAILVLLRVTFFKKRDRDIVFLKLLVVLLMGILVGILVISLFKITLDPKSLIRVLFIVGVAVGTHVFPAEVLRFVETVSLSSVRVIFMDFCVCRFVVDSSSVVHSGFGMGRLRLHFEDEIASLDRYVLGMEDTGVGVEATTGLVPPFAVELFEVVTPVQVEFV